MCTTAPSQPCLELSARWIEFPQVGTRTPHPNWKKGAEGELSQPVSQTDPMESARSRLSEGQDEETEL
ncbi:hypothetical protein ROHU_017516 [Labeo rohita]|uniref:Uncharacterized protein n=1 Tax=Labeo rohita TaxID=84645 RepID=A0A498NG86_LABRO|nr:hypothetical protein ROHU_017516 [Labeo rohita]